MDFLKRIKYWSLFLGLLFILAGIWVFSTPLESYITLSILFSIVFIINGISEIFFYISKGEKENHYGWGIAGGILDLLFGFWLLSSPQLTILVLPFYIGFTLMLQSAMAISGSFTLKSMQFKHWGWILIFGILGLIFSFILIGYPGFAELSIVFWTGLSLITVGIAKFIYSLSY
jgi:uncharacterized membrane protein HdeD (DUF308 family)